MGKKSSLSETRRAQIVILHQEGKSERQTVSTEVSC